MATENQNTMEIDNFKSTAELTSNPGFQSTISVAPRRKKSVKKPYNPFEHRNVDHPTTVFASIVHLLKACLGTGLLAMPSAYKNSGLLVGFIGTIFAGIICTHTVHVLVRTAQELCVEMKKPSLSFAETCGAAFSHGPKRLRSWGPYVKILVDYSLFLCYVSVLCVYVVFIASSLKEVVDYYTTGPKLSIQKYCALTLIPLVLICQIRNLKFLVPFSGIANVGILVVFLITLYFIFTDLPRVSERQLAANISKWPLFFSTVVFAMEGIGVVMPVENEMARPHKFLGCPGVLNISMAVIIFLFQIVGFFGYLKYGDAVKGSITLNLPEDYIIAQSAKILMAFVIFLSFTIQFYVPMEVVTRKLKDHKIEKHYNLVQIGCRTFIVCFAVGVAALFPNLELVISFVGAIFFASFGIVFPAVVETVYRWNRDLGRFDYILWKNIIIAMIGLTALISGTYVSMVGIIEEFYSDHNEDTTKLIASNVTLF